MRYTKTQSLYLSRKNVLPEIVDLFGMADFEVVDDANQEIPEAASEPETVEAADTDSVKPEPVAEPAQDPEDDIDSFFG